MGLVEFKNNTKLVHYCYNFFAASVTPANSKQEKLIAVAR